MQILRLPYVDHTVKPIPKKIHPWLMRQIPQLLYQLNRNRFH